jgi:hypothetical protein
MSSFREVVEPRFKAIEGGGLLDDGLSADTQEVAFDGGLHIEAGADVFAFLTDGAARRARAWIAGHTTSFFVAEHPSLAYPRRCHAFRAFSLESRYDAMGCGTAISASAFRHTALRIVAPVMGDRIAGGGVPNAGSMVPVCTVS